MPKWSDYIRNLGTAGPATLQGIYDLGFALRSEIPALFNKYVRVDAAQSFTNPEKAQGRANIGAIIGTDVQAWDAGLQSIAGLTTVADRLIYLTAPDVYAVTPFTVFARTLMDDPDAATARATLILGNVDNTSDANKPVSTAQQTALNLKANAANAALTGVPVAPTAAPGTNTTQVATTAFVLANSGVISLGTAQNSTSGTNIDFTGVIPPTAKRVTLNLVGVSTNGVSPLRVQLGTSSGFVTTGYLGSVGATNAAATLVTNGLGLADGGTAAALVHGKIVIDLVTGNTWAANSLIGRSDAGSISVSAGTIALGGVLDRIRLTTSGGTDAFDAGIVNISWE